MALVVSTADPVLLTTEEALAHPGIDGDADVIQLYIDAITEIFENYAGPILPRVVTETVRGTGAAVLEGRVVSIDTVSLYGVAVTDHTFRAGAGLLYPPTYGTLDGAEITYTVGFSPIPQAIKLAALYAVQHATESDQGAVVNGDTDEVFTLSRGDVLTPRVKTLLEPWRRGATVG